MNFFSDFCLWDPASQALESVIQLELSGILQTIENGNPNSTDKKYGLPLPGIRSLCGHSDHSVESRTVLDWVGLGTSHGGEADLDKSGATNEGFLLNTLKALFRISRVLLDLQKCIINSAIKFASAQGELESFSKLQGLQYHFPENFICNF